MFRALADPGRRALLDRLAETDGLSVNELCTVLPEMSRFGVMKHLGVLEEAHLVTTQRDGRRKLHYLNPIPIRQIHDRWISRYTAPFAAALSDLASASIDETLTGGGGRGRTETRVRDVHQGDAG